MKIKWIKKQILRKEWEIFYSKNASYCSLDGGKSVGFLIVGDIPEGCEECDEHDIRQIDVYRRASNTKPYPFKGKEERQENFSNYKERKEAREELSKMKKELKNVFSKPFSK